MMTAASIHAAWRHLPLGTLSDIIGNGACLVLAPHPDDESLGCGGLIAACIADHRPPLVAILTDGTGSHPHSRAWPPDRLKALRYQEASDATRILGLPRERLIFLGAKDTVAPTEGPEFDALARRLTAKLDGITAILSPWRHDPHCDHHAAAVLAAHVARDTGLRHVAYPVWGWTLPPEQTMDGEHTSGWRLDIGPWRPLKHAAIHAHRSQLGRVIDDDPAGFVLSEEFKSLFDTPYETYLAP
jgi:LmbE family N-acetylglucosaminyl deacetylase